MKFIKCPKCHKKNTISSKKCIKCKTKLKIEEETTKSYYLNVKLLKKLAIIFSIILLVLIGNYIYNNIYIHRITNTDLKTALDKKATGKVQEFNCDKNKELTTDEVTIYSCDYTSLSTSLNFKQNTTFNSSKKKGTATLSCSKKKLDNNNEARCIVENYNEIDVDLKA